MDAQVPKCLPAWPNGHLGLKMPAHVLKHALGHQNARRHAQTGAQAPKCPPACPNGRPGTKMPARCAQTGTQAPKINFINKILKRLKKKEEEEERRTKQYIEVA